LNINLFPVSNSSNEPGKFASKGKIPVKLNRVYFKTRSKNIIERQKEFEKIENRHYLENEFCRRNCRDKLFKNIDLDQRYYLKKEIINLHCENCPLNLKDSHNIRTSSIPTSFREKRKSNNNTLKDETLLNISMAKSTTNGKTNISNKSPNKENRILDDLDIRSDL
jgi:hypothetical protein